MIRVERIFRHRSLEIQDWIQVTAAVAKRAVFTPELSAEEKYLRRNLDCNFSGDKDSRLIVWV